MGLSMFSGSSYDSKPAVIYETVRLPNPDPKNFKIIKSESINLNVIVWVNYPDCTNYEGDKILFFHNRFLREIEDQKVLDPHFSENTDYISPFARFQPAEAGWKAALILAYNI